MPQSLTKLYAHLIFSTKNRQPYLTSGIRSQVHAYLSTLVRDSGSPHVVVGGVEDHVHLLFDMGKSLAPVKFVEFVKRDSSKFIKTLSDDFNDFYWQRGYGMFSVSPIHVQEVTTYINSQEEHHQKVTFREELLSFLKRYNIEYDEQYLWD